MECSTVSEMKPGDAPVLVLLNSMTYCSNIILPVKGYQKQTAGFKQQAISISIADCVLQIISVSGFLLFLTADGIILVVHPRDRMEVITEYLERA